MIPTQFGHIPDLAFEEIKQLRAQQAQLAQQSSLPFSTASLGLSPTLNVNNSNDLANNLTRTAARDLSITHLNGVVRSRSLASNSTRPQIGSFGNGANSTVYSTGLFSNHKPANSSSNRYGIMRSGTGTINNNNPPAPASSSLSYASNRSVPVHSSTHARPRPANRSSATVNHDPQRPHYETTYRSSFIKPLAP